MCNYQTDCNDDFNPNEAWEQQDDEPDEEYQERLDDWNDTVEYNTD